MPSKRKSKADRKSENFEDIDEASASSFFALSHEGLRAIVSLWTASGRPQSESLVSFTLRLDKVLRLYKLKKLNQAKAPTPLERSEALDTVCMQASALLETLMTLQAHVAADLLEELANCPFELTGVLQFKSPADDIGLVRLDLATTAIEQVRDAAKRASHSARAEKRRGRRSNYALIWAASIITVFYELATGRPADRSTKRGGALELISKLVRGVDPAVTEVQLDTALKAVLKNRQDLGAAPRGKIPGKTG